MTCSGARREGTTRIGNPQKATSVKNKKRPRRRLFMNRSCSQRWRSRRSSRLSSQARLRPACRPMPASRRRGLCSRKRRAGAVRNWRISRSGSQARASAALAGTSPDRGTAAGRSSLPRRVGDGGQARSLAAVGQLVEEDARDEPLQADRADGERGLFAVEGRVGAARWNRERASAFTRTALTRRKPLQDLDGGANGAGETRTAPAARGDEPGEQSCRGFSSPPGIASRPGG